MEKTDLQNEKNYFNRVEEIIRKKLAKLHADKTLLKDRILRERKEMWDENRHLIRDFDDVILLSSQDTDISRAEDRYERNELEIRRLTKMEKAPYFGRLDFTENITGEENTIYIGVYSLMEEDSYEIVVVDWRAPISSMFYNFDLGPAWYEVNDHKEEACITKKRQYRIEDGRFLYAYDTESSLYDDILGEVLSQYSDHKLKVIIGSIQKEQNLAIRSDTRRSCLICGLAGSGKTSIGLHRLAYVLYHNKDTMSSENILILSNNNIFSSYISTILPDLGERPAETKVFADLLEAFLDKDMEIEDYYSQLKRIEMSPASERIKRLRVRNSADLLEYCIDYFASFPFQIPEIRYKETIVISPEMIRRRLNARNFSSFKSRYEMLEHLVRKAIEDFFLSHKDEIYNEIEESHDEILSVKEAGMLYSKTLQTYVQSAKDEIIRLNSLDPKTQAVTILSDYLRQTGGSDDEAANLSDSLKRGKLLYEDALFYLLVKVLMGEAAPFPDIRHTVIDESQDYSLIQLYVIKCLLPKSSFTLLGDIYQTVNSVTTMQKYDDYQRIFGTDLMQIRLSKCYRSSSDINALAFELIDRANRPIAKEYSYFTRAVRKPQYIICRDLFSCLVPILDRLEKYHSVAVIVNSDEEAVAVRSHLGESKEAQLIISPEDEIKARLVVIPLLLAKGLEFDAVILFNCIYFNQNNDHLRRKVYLGCTRALHELYFVERDILPDSLRGCGPYMEIET
ncbi:MAG: ATP-binding domain-containing protein [Lachnospiraceae bacterium]|nr:ATP-binding domain-containing protein [Lachnospiraceae bacterium]MCM1239909.1 ATP-binding domain-containing protein [Lachnospiraceae bacterium]MCM1305202.1 ATP-binding domain-containing protein [Butyrivibrio sp.]MCM1344665.1 ATP-binding domain-containing protein [Muribaculaceae bacterium]MCM1412394.1 ATP-binding domain-containing protein [Lachnospiraceae bacterium]